MSETPAAKLTPQHVAVLALIAAGAHKVCTSSAMTAIWSSAFKEVLEWKHFRSGNRYVYLNLIWDTGADEWAVQYVRTGAPGPITFSRTITSFFETVIDGDLNQVLRFEPWSAS